MSETLRLDGRVIELSHQDKTYFPQAGFSKGDLIAYYRRMAPTMLPHMRQRPLSLQRFPDGIQADGFYQKEAPDTFPDWIERVMIPVEAEGEKQPQVMGNDAASLIYLVNLGCITPHAWLSRSRNVRQPDRLIFDLDPPSADDFDSVRAAAQALRTVLEEAGLVPFVMTTGSRGLHVRAPLDGRTDFDTVRAFARQAAEGVAQQEPDRFTTETRKAQRNGRLFLDYLRNAYAQTAVVPYAVRPLPGAPVAAPLDWRELDRADLQAQRYTVRNIFRRLGQKADPWRDMDQYGRPLPARQALKF